jgi:RNA polymerase sigma-70 factor (ECF subfamily)
MSEQALIDGCIAKNRMAQRQLYEQYAGKLLVVCNRYSHTSAEAEDILQDAFIKIFEKIGSFRQECPLGAWLKRIVVNTALNAVRSRNIWEDYTEVFLTENQIIEEKTSLSHLHFQELIALIRKLPKGCQTVFNLYAIEGYQHNEIAELLAISEGTSKSQYARARTLLQVMLRQDGVEYTNTQQKNSNKLTNDNGK